MRDDFDSVVADHFKVLDDVPVPDTWSRVLDRVPVRDARSLVPFSDEALTMIDLDTPGTDRTPSPSSHRDRGRRAAGGRRRWSPSSSCRRATSDPPTQPMNRPRP